MGAMHTTRSQWGSVAVAVVDNNEPRGWVTCRCWIEKDKTSLDTQQSNTSTNAERSTLGRSGQTVSDATLAAKTSHTQATRYKNNDLSRFKAAINFVPSADKQASPCGHNSATTRSQDTQIALGTTRSSPSRQTVPFRLTTLSRDTQRAYLVNTMARTTLSFSSLQRRNGTAPIRR